MRVVHLDDDLLQLKGVGPKVSEKLSKLGLNTIQDVLFAGPAMRDECEGSPKGRHRLQLTHGAARLN